jgi:hypothetical protein
MNKIIDINKKRLANKYLLNELKKISPIYSSGWISNDEKEYLKVLLHATIQRRFKRYK